jgi:hypothetical protein
MGAGVAAAAAVVAVDVNRDVDDVDDCELLV